MIDRAGTLVNVAKDIIRQDQDAKIILQEDLYGQLNKLSTLLISPEFTQALRPDKQRWKPSWLTAEKECVIRNTIIAYPIDEGTDHLLITDSLETTLIERR